MSAWTWIGSVLVILTYFPLWCQILKRKVSQNFLTWMLWAVLDGIAAVSILFQKGNFFLPIIYATGGLITTLCIIKAENRVSWTWFETFIVLLIVVSMVIWYQSGNKMATVASTSAVFVAGFPQIIDAWKKPQEMPLLIYISYFIGNVLCTVGGKSWSVEERFYPVAGVALCLTLVIFTARRFWKNPAL